MKIENYRRKLVNMIYPNSYGKLLFVVEAINNYDDKEHASINGSSDDEEKDYFRYRKHDLFIVLDMQIDGNLFVQRGQKTGLIYCENVRIFDQVKKNLEKPKLKMSKPAHPSFDNSYAIEEEDQTDEFDTLRTRRHKIFVSNPLEVGKEFTRVEIEQYLETKSKEMRFDEIKLSKTNKIKLIFMDIYTGIYTFFDSVIHDKFKRGVDLYIPMFLTELLCLAFLFVFQGSLINDEGNFIDFFLSDYLPFSYVLFLFLQFMFIIVDRIIYLLKSITLKLCMQYFTLIYYHILIFVYFPLTIKKSSWITTL